MLGDGVKYSTLTSVPLTDLRRRVTAVWYTGMGDIYIHDIEHQLLGPQSNVHQCFVNNWSVTIIHSFSIAYQHIYVHDIEEQLVGRSRMYPSVLSIIDQ